MIHFVTFKWNSDSYRIKYESHHVNILEAMVRRHYAGQMRFVCVTDDASGITGETFPLWTDCAELVNASGEHLPSCYRRLKLFDPQTQAALGIEPGDRLVSLDLDTVIAGDLTPLFDRPEPFVGWAVLGSHHARVFNGSMWMLRAGEHADVWTSFDPDASPRMAREARYLGSDQAWMSMMLKGAAGWTTTDGVASYPRDVERLDELPDGVRVVMFHGFNKPWSRRARPWVGQHYRIAGPEGRCLILGYDPAVWHEALAAEGPFQSVIASPEAAAHRDSPGWVWGDITAVAQNDDHAERLAAMLGYAPEQIVFCGRQRERTAA